MGKKKKEKNSGPFLIATGGHGILQPLQISIPYPDTFQNAATTTTSVTSYNQ
jgi:hypothetical protein